MAAQHDLAQPQRIGERDYRDGTRDLASSGSGIEHLHQVVGHQQTRKLVCMERGLDIGPLNGELVRGVIIACWEPLEHLDVLLRPNADRWQVDRAGRPGR